MLLFEETEVSENAEKSPADFDLGIERTDSSLREDKRRILVGDQNKNTIKKMQQRLAQNLHVVFCSNNDDLSADIFRCYPKILHSSYLLKWHQWTQADMFDVCNFYLSSKMGADEGIVNLTANAIVNIHNNILRKQMAKGWESKLLTFIESQSNEYEEMTQQLLQDNKKLSNGLEMLQDAERASEALKIKLEALAPGLTAAEKDSLNLLELIDLQQKEVDAMHLKVKKEEIICQSAESKAVKLNNDCKADLAKVIPELEKSIEEVSDVNKDDITEIRSLKQPPTGVKLTIICVALLLKVATLFIYHFCVFNSKEFFFR
jgi:dynein heavy chain